MRSGIPLPPALPLSSHQTKQEAAQGGLGQAWVLPFLPGAVGVPGKVSWELSAKLSHSCQSGDLLWPRLSTLWSSRKT